MSDVVFMKLLFVAGLLGLFAGAVLIGHAMAWLQNRLASRRAKSERTLRVRQTRWRTLL